jgi:hypothetical protein
MKYLTIVDNQWYVRSLFMFEDRLSIDAHENIIWQDNDTKKQNTKEKERTRIST